MIKLVPRRLSGKEVAAFLNGDKLVIAIEAEEMDTIAERWLTYSMTVRDNERNPCFITAALAQIAREALEGE